MLGCDVEAAMQFLNDAASQYPQAISLAAGRPPDRFLLTQQVPGWIERFAQHRARDEARDPAEVWQSLGQYSRTQGIINSLLAKFLNQEEGLSLTASELLITNGFQEALAITLMGLIDRERDLVLAIDPTYPGLSGVVNALAMSALPVDSALPDAIRAACRAAELAGKRAKVLYLVPDFSNPTGDTLSYQARTQLLDVCSQLDITILEDTAYRSFSYADSEPAPSLGKLATTARVFTLGSFAKTLMPGLRLGYVSGPAEVIDRLTKIKSFVSVATSPVTQAALGGYLLEADRWGEVRNARRAWCRANLERLMAELEEAFGARSALHGRVQWSRPRGGFFVTVDLEFEFGVQEMQEAASDYGVLVCPMSMFSLRGAGQRRIRLAFSNVTTEAVSEAVQRLRRYIGDKVS